ncbi:nitrogen permease regulator 2-domain-containing protein [Mortierella sp. GBAus27b]|nr:nitrogen permease regulator 2-domain-containing protein [Mortierella sp. GBAus27b]
MGFPRLLSVFYCTFHPFQGPKVMYEVPEGSILSKTSPLVDFDSISEYLIPKVELCSKLVTISTPTCKVVGFPIYLEHTKFLRNALMFNLAFVFDKDAETSSYEPVVRKMARVLKALEKENEFLSRQTRYVLMGSGNVASSLHSSSVPSTPATTSASAMAIQASKLPLTGSASNTETVQPSGNAHTGNNGILETISEAASAMSLNETSTSDTTTQGQAQGVGGSTAPAEPSGSDPSAAPVDSAQLASTITSSSLVSSPPHMIGNATTPVIMAPPSSSPFPLSKSSSTSSTTTVNNPANGTTSAPTSQKSTPLILPLQDQPDGSGMQNLIEQLLEDLNSYCECQIPVDSANTINLKLFPTYPNPTPVYDYQVPISTVHLEALTDVSWDMTMQRITRFINGVNSVKRIAEYADVETGLARLCMQHLLYYGCIIMVDLFQFKNIYAVKLEMMRLTEDLALQSECVSYVTLPDMYAPSFAKIFSLYCSLQYGVVLQDWIEQNQIADYNIDVRRFISFGMIKGFLYRVHKYPIMDYHDPANFAGVNPANQNTRTDTHTQISTTMAMGMGAIAPLSNAVVAPPVITSYTTLVTNAPGTISASSSTHKKVYVDPSEQQQQPQVPPQQQQSSENGSVVIPPALRKLLDGRHHYDELCTTFGCSVKDMDQILATDSRVKFIYR